MNNEETCTFDSSVLMDCLALFIALLSRDKDAICTIPNPVPRKKEPIIIYVTEGFSFKNGAGPNMKPEIMKQTWPTIDIEAKLSDLPHSHEVSNAKTP